MSNTLKLDQQHLQQKCSQKNLVFGNSGDIRIDYCVEERCTQAQV